MTDTSAAQARKGKDIQGITWEGLNVTRQSYRLTRLEQYRNYENIPLSGEAVDKVSALQYLYFIELKGLHLGKIIIIAGHLHIFRYANKWRRVVTTTNSFTMQDP